MQITSKKQLEEIIGLEQKNIFGEKGISAETKYRKSFRYMSFLYIKALRKYEYCCCMRDKTNGISRRIWALKVKKADRRKNELSLAAGLDFRPFSVEPGVKVFHPNVVLNGIAQEGCVFHGSNVLGNKCTGSKETPTLGRNVDVGFGASIIGNVEIADNCIIGAGAVVTKSFTEPGSKIAGVPAKKI